MNVWILNNSAGSPKHGMVYRNFYLSESLKKKGYTCFTISSTYNHQFYKQPTANKLFNYENIDGVEYCFVRSKKYHGNGLGRVIAFFDYAAKVFFNISKIKFPKPNIIIASSPMPLLGILGNIIARKYNAKFIFEIRDLWPETLIELGSFSRSHPFIKLLAFSEKYSLHRADAVVAVMPNADKYLTTIGMSPDIFYYIPNGISVTEMEKNNSSTSVSFPIEKNLEFTYVCYAGAIGTANKMDTLIDAAKLLRNEKIVFVIIGDGPQRKSLAERSCELPNVHFVGTRPKDEIPSILKQCDICYVGAQDKDIYKYGISFTKIYDYLYSGKPIVCAVNSSNKIIDDAKAGKTVSPNSPEEIANAILEISRLSEEERMQMGNSGKNYVLANNTWDVLSDAYVNVFRKISEPK